MDEAHPTKAVPDTTRQWLTVQECADEIRVDVEVVRGWCIAHESGDQNGLPSSHFGVDLSGAAKRKNRRIHAQDWEEFKQRQRGQELRRAPEPVLRVEPVQIPTRAERRRMRAVTIARVR